MEGWLCPALFKYVTGPLIRSTSGLNRCHSGDSRISLRQTAQGPTPVHTRSCTTFLEEILGCVDIEIWWSVALYQLIASSHRVVDRLMAMFRLADNPVVARMNFSVEWPQELSV